MNALGKVLTRAAERLVERHDERHDTEPENTMTAVGSSPPPKDEQAVWGAQDDLPKKCSAGKVRQIRAVNALPRTTIRARGAMSLVTKPMHGDLRCDGLQRPP